jgi:transcriptional regulator with XRE-family HTH domain
MKAEEIKEKRKELGLTQKKLAEMIGVSTQTINGYENGKEIPSTKYQILDSILNKPESIILNDVGIKYTTLPGYNKKVDQLEELIIENEKILTLAKVLQDENLINHHTEIIKLLKKQIKLVLKAQTNHFNNL